MVQINVLQPQSLALVICSLPVQISNSGACKNCGTESSLTITGQAKCNGSYLKRFFTYTVAKDLSKFDDIRKFHGILTLEKFDVDTTQLPNLQSWL